jgi:hypothetical protein
MIYGDNIFAEEEAAVEAAPELSDSDKLRQLGAGLGLFSEETPDDVSIETASEETPPVAEAVPDEVQSFSFKTEEDFQAAALKAFETKLGAPLDAVVQMLEDFGGYRNQQLIEEQKQPLKSEWGTEFDDRYAQVVEKFQTLPPEMQKALDNTEGAKLIWALIEKEGGSSVPSVPTFDRKGSTLNRAKAKFSYTQSQIEGMDMKTYRANAEDINNAYQNGLVDYAN